MQPDNTPIRYTGQDPALRTQHSYPQNVVPEHLTDQEIEIYGKRLLAQRTNEERRALVDAANRELGELYFQTNATYAYETGRTLALRDQLRNQEHRALASGFFQDMTDEFAVGLIQNFRTARSEMHRVVGGSLAPERPVVRERKLTAIERILGRAKFPDG